MGYPKQDMKITDVEAVQEMKSNCQASVGEEDVEGRRDVAERVEVGTKQNEWKNEWKSLARLLDITFFVINFIINTTMMILYLVLMH